MALALTTTARKTYLVKSENNLAFQPRVLKYDCSKYLFENDDDYAGLQYTTNLELGWNWVQTQLPGNNYHLKLEVYTKQYAEVHPVFSSPRLIFIEQFLTLQSFKAIGAIDFVFFFPKHLSCINVFYNYQAVNLIYKMGFKLQECIKNIIYNITSWE